MSNRDSRRAFVKKAAAGLALFGASGVTGCDAASGGSEPVASALEPSEANMFRYVLAKTEFPLSRWDSTLAAAKLSRDLFDRPSVATTFAADPQAYWNSLGLSGVALDLESIEVKLATTVGDPEGRSLIEAKDYAGYIAFLERKGLLDLGTFQKTAEGTMRAAMTSCQVEYGDCDFAYALAVLLVVVAVTYVTVGYTVAAVTMVETAAALHSVVATSTTTAGALSYERAPALTLLSALGGDEASHLGADAYISQTVERIALTLEASQTYVQRGGPVGTDLRDLVRAKLSQAVALPV